jgi:hypothetical protein
VFGSRKILFKNSTKMTVERKGKKKKLVFQFELMVSYMKNAIN